MDRAHECKHATRKRKRSYENHVKCLTKRILPFDILVHAISFLNAKDHILGARFVCKEWNKASHHCASWPSKLGHYYVYTLLSWTNFPRFDSCEARNKLDRMFVLFYHHYNGWKNLHELDINAAFIKIYERASNVSSLHLYILTDRDRLEFNGASMQNWKSVRNLTVAFSMPCKPFQWCTWFPSLRSLTIQIYEDNLLQNIANDMVELKELSNLTVGHIRASDIPRLVECLPRAAHVSLSIDGLVDDSIWSHLSKLNDTLRHLSIFDGKLLHGNEFMQRLCITDLSISHASRSFFAHLDMCNLTTLAITSCDMDNSDIEIILSRAPNLSNLELRYLDNITSSMVWPHHTKVTTLFMFDCINVRDLTFLDHVPLRVLSCYVSQRIKDSFRQKHPHCTVC